MAIWKSLEQGKKESDLLKALIEEAEIGRAHV